MADDFRGSIRFLATLNAALGVWLVSSSLAFGPTNTLAINGAVCGVLIIVCAAARAAVKGSSVLSWINAIVGAWLVVSPWIIGGVTRDFRTWNFFIVGVLVAGVAVLSLTSSGVRPQSGSVRRIG
jgi:SPW repeat